MQGFRAQGATEYLVLLAVVLIIALVAIALLGFFPGTASDAQIEQSQIYWQSASPIAITEWGARAMVGQANAFYIRIRNSGTYPIRITKLTSAGGDITQFYCWDSSFCSPVGGTAINISNFFYITPGEEKYFSTWPMRLPAHEVWAWTGSSSGIQLGGATSLCQDNSPWGTLVLPNFGFEYIQYVENQQITKRQIGNKPLTIKCRDSCVGNPCAIP